MPDSPNIIPARYLYRHIPTSTEQGPFMPLFPGACSNTRQGHDEQIAEFNRRHSGVFLHAWQEIQPGDFDHPDTVERKEHANA